ncbi:unnamed protein product [Moneuplotes crassus]|uniref:Uncharacterized protein n=1 Tax=Euplotes crassus TaxID=5936 RepID=A0AAD1Y9H0_EUPCR|nr:unnamed protein product [Moneuplotes crassus]
MPTLIKSAESEVRKMLKRMKNYERINLKEAKTMKKKDERVEAKAFLENEMLIDVAHMRKLQKKFHTNIANLRWWRCPTSNKIGANKFWP